MGKIRILKPGMLTTIQDMGRYGYQKYGISVSGAMDSYSLQLANILVGNDRNEACIEVTMVGPTIEFISDSVFAVTGANFPLKVNGCSIPMNQSVKAQSGDILELNVAEDGVRGYIAFAGGIQVAPILGSKSTYIKAKIGGITGMALKDEVIDIGTSEFKSKQMRRLPKEYIANNLENSIARVIMGPDESRFTNEGIQNFFGGRFILTQHCDRMGYRFSGPKIQHLKGADIISSGIAMGTIQITPDGNPILMMADRQTSGGYTRIATVISIDIPVVSQLRPGSSLEFKEVDIETAHFLLCERENKIKELELKFQELDNISFLENQYVIRINGKRYDVSIRMV